jgi:hypothetical protein
MQTAEDFSPIISADTISSSPPPGAAPLRI